MGRSARILIARFLRPSALLAAATLVACGGEQPAAVTQVVARVNDRDITLAQLAHALQAQGDPITSSRAVEETIESLIDEQLLVGEAVAQGFHREPTVAQALELAHVQALARLYAQRVVFPHEPLDEALLLDYYYNHPELFSQRRIYQVTAYVLHQADLSEYMQAELRSMPSAQGIPEVLERYGIAYEVRALTRAAEQLPIEALPNFGLARVGDLIVLQPHEGQRTLMLITGIQDSPVDRERALPIIGQYLLNTRNTRALQAHLRQARASAAITVDRDAARSFSEALGIQTVHEVAPAPAQVDGGTTALNKPVQSATPLLAFPAAPAGNGPLQNK
jgi:EpsD family peptidyl-prolyl cis-trans isomerase